MSRKVNPAEMRVPEHPWAGPFPVRFTAKDQVMLEDVAAMCDLSISDVIRRCVRHSGPLFLSGSAPIVKQPKRAA